MSQLNNNEVSIMKKKELRKAANFRATITVIIVFVAIAKIVKKYTNVKD